MLKILVSGCLGGAPIRFNETGVPVASPLWQRWASEGRLVSLCPELAVGFPVPRPPAEIVGGSAADVLDGRARVHEASGRDVTELFQAAAQRAPAPGHPARGKSVPVERSEKQIRILDA